MHSCVGIFCYLFILWYIYYSALTYTKRLPTFNSKYCSTACTTDVFQRNSFVAFERVSIVRTSKGIACLILQIKSIHTLVRASTHNYTHVHTHAHTTPPPTPPTPHTHIYTHTHTHTYTYIHCQCRHVERLLSCFSLTPQVCEQPKPPTSPSSGKRPQSGRCVWSLL